MSKESPTACRVSLLEGHANALALNKEGNQIAIAGRSLLKVFAVGDDGFSEMFNMRGGKNQNLSYSSNDVAWNPLNSNILATASTNGVVGIWDLSKFGRQKQLMVYNEHGRTAHTVTFHNTEPNILISGSQDGTIKCFDLCRERSVQTFFSNSEPVRDLKFSPHTASLFAAVSENGTVQLWDVRRSDKCVFQFTAHSNPIYTCDWHPKHNWLATGGRDKQIKIWNMTHRCNLQKTINTIAVVGRVKWRPNHDDHIASSALMTDNSVHVWGMNRPYMPFASFNEHTNITTDIAWHPTDSDCLFSTSKDLTIYKHAFKDAVRLADKANLQGACSGRNGDITFARDIRPPRNQQNGKSGRKENVPTGAVKFIMSATTGVKPETVTVSSKLVEFHTKATEAGCKTNELGQNLQEDESFVGYARAVWLSDKSFVEICENNVAVSKKFGKHYAATLWHFLKLLYGCNDFVSIKEFEIRSSFSKQKNAFRRPIQSVSEWGTQHASVSGTDVNGNSQMTDSTRAHLENEIGMGGSEQTSNLPTSAVILSETQIINKITFDNFELLKNGFIYVGTSEDTKSLSFPETALHHDVQAARPQLELKAANHEKTPPTITVEPSILKISNPLRTPAWEPHHFVAEALQLQADVGDVQVPVTILIALGETRKLLPLDEAQIEYWFHTYIDQLHNFELWNQACVLYNLSWLRSVRTRNQPSTSVHLNCGKCGRSISAGVGGYCKRCKSIEPAKCSVCNLVVHGIYVWCQDCSHGGHVEHLQKYFGEYPKRPCPKCAHICTFS